MSITLSYPVISPIYTVELLNQNMEDADTFELPVQYGRSMNGTFYTYIKTPSKRTFSYSFTNVSQAILDDLEELFIAAAGNQVRLIDYNDLNWSCLILTNPLDIGYDGSTLCGDVGGFTLILTGTSIAAVGTFFLLETGDQFLLETGDSLLLEN